MDCVALGFLVGGMIGLVMGFFERRTPHIPSLEEKHVFITGGSTGIGYCIAKNALSLGAYVTMTGRSLRNLQKAYDSLTEEVVDTEKRIRFKAVDASDYKLMSEAINESNSWKPIDVLVCNAGLTRSGYLDQMPIEDLDLTVQTNILGTVYPVHSALPLMKQRSPDHPMSIVFIGSLASLFLMYGNSVYTATKYALKGMAESLRLELLPYSIRVSLVCPGFVRTAFLDEAEKRDELQILMKQINMYDRNQAQTPDEVAKKTLEAVKYGSAIVTTTPILGTALLILARGFIPDDSILKTFQEVLAYPLVRIFTIFAKFDMHRRIMAYHHRNPSPGQMRSNASK
ncbi:hypothetical protein R1flu_027932 [Riccia fluitans]|uniref:NAD(P)-binding protein n=1 Tax=Riccia fluitans TaxID=41844 RepID=A0ABD1XKR0_9MARC